MTHLDLFSGIGGFALAVDQVWPGSTHIFCDTDLFCQAVLKKHWPNSKIYGDIRSITKESFTYTEGAGQLREKQLENDSPSKQRGGSNDIEPKNKIYGDIRTITDTESDRLNWGISQSLLKRESNGSTESGENVYGQVDLLTGGFPCQPFSQAGRRRGTADDRYLWPEMLRVIQLTKPTWIIGENVGGFVTWNEGMVLEQVCTDLEDEGYEVQPFIIPAVSVNAPHRRDRVWIVAHNNHGESRPGDESEPTKKTHSEYGTDNSSGGDVTHSGNQSGGGRTGSRIWPGNTA